MRVDCLDKSRYIVLYLFQDFIGCLILVENTLEHILRATALRILGLLALVLRNVPSLLPNLFFLSGISIPPLSIRIFQTYIPYQTLVTTLPWVLCTITNYFVGEEIHLLIVTTPNTP